MKKLIRSRLQNWRATHTLILGIRTLRVLLLLLQSLLVRASLLQAQFPLQVLPALAVLILQIAVEMVLTTISNLPPPSITR